MGVGPVALALYVDLVERNIIKSGQSVFELGSQDFVPDGFDVKSVLRAFGADAMYGHFSSSRTFHAALGCPYQCVDLDGHYGAHRWNLNSVNAGGIRPFDIVTNHGTTEHVFHQENCFRFVHDATKVGGIMIHIVPTQGYENHCFYLYTKVFFNDLAHANNYETIRLYDIKDRSPVVGETGTLCVAVMRRTVPGQFKIPQQVRYGLCTS